LEISPLLQEVFDSLDPDNYNNPHFRLPSRQTNNFNLFKQYAFQTASYRYFSEFEAIFDDIIAVSFYARLPHNFKSNQKFGGNKYAYLTNDKERLKVLNTVFHQMLTIANENPNFSFIFFGAPDIDPQTGTIKKDPNDPTFQKVDVNNTKRFKLYELIARSMFSVNRYKIATDPSKSAIAVVSLQGARENPNLEENIIRALNRHS
jgi:hypothetical protein